MSIKFRLQEATLKLNVLTLALAATVFTTLGAAAQPPTGTGLTGDCTSKTVHKEDLTGEKTVSKTKCD